MAWGLAIASVAVVFYLHLETWRLVLPLVLMSLGMMLWLFNAGASLVLMLRQSPKEENFYVYLLNLVANVLPLVYFGVKMATYPGPRTQFLFEWFTSGSRHLLD